MNEDLKSKVKAYSEAIQNDKLLNHLLTMKLYHTRPPSVLITDGVVSYIEDTQSAFITEQYKQRIEEIKAYCGL